MFIYIDVGGILIGYMYIYTLGMYRNYPFFRRENIFRRHLLSENFLL